MKPKLWPARITLICVCAVFLLPLLLAFFISVQGSLGIMPTLASDRFGFSHWIRVIQDPRIWHSVAFSAFTGIASTLISLILALGIVSRLPKNPPRFMLPILASPHAAIAIGLAFLIAPSGWLVRLFSELFFGFDRPPNWITVHDQMGFSLILGLVIKETPFLILMIYSALRQLPWQRQSQSIASMGYEKSVIWWRFIVPMLYPFIRLPIYVVLAFGLSVVDMALVLAPNNPPSLAVQSMRWFYSPDLSNWPRANVAGIMNVMLVLIAILFWRLCERGVWRWVVQASRKGNRQDQTKYLSGISTIFARIIMWLGMMTLAIVLIWSMAWRWSFPNLWPDSLSWLNWRNLEGNWPGLVWQSLMIGMISSLFSAALAIFWLEAEDQAQKPRAGWATLLIYFPLLMPQIAFLFGLNQFFMKIGTQNTQLAVIWAHSFFVFSYIMIALSDPWKALDARYIHSSASLGMGPIQRLLRIKLPLLMRPILIAIAIGFAVSIAQYLPTIFAGGGRIETLTTEAVALSSGGDRRLTGLFATLQSAMPLLIYGLAIGLTAWRHRNRKAMKGLV